ncbi:hypothetical protein GCM10028807_30000 [Spirosoma daeguense]
MRKLFFALLICIPSLVNAQNFTALKLNATAGYALPLYQGASKGGFVYSVEPRYHVTRQIAVGLRFEQAFISRTEILNNNLEYTSQAKSTLSGLATVNYLFGKKTVQPFIGIGAGLYHIEPSAQLLNGPSSTIYRFSLPATNQFGGMVRIGVNYSAITAEVAANLMDDSSISYVNMNSVLTGKNSYFTAKIGYTLGGKQR